MDTATVTGGLSEEERKLLTEVGYEPDAHRSGTYVLVNQEVRHTAVSDDGVEVLSLKDALNKHDWVQDLMFGLIDPQENDHVRQVAEQMHDPVGHFIHVREGAKVKLPVQSFSLLETPQGRQYTHDLTVIDAGAEVEMISGAAVPPNVHAGHHISIDETYVRAGAVCRSLSIEHWGTGMEVHSYGRTQIDKGAHVSGKQVQMTPIRHHAGQSKTYIGEDARYNEQAIMFAPEGTERVVDSEIHLKASGAHAESLARMVTAGGTIINKAMLVGDSAGVSGFLGCDGLKLSDDGEVLSIPALKANAAEAQLSHEASVGMIGADKMAYLMATGMTDDAARDLIIQGFLHLNEQNLPAVIRASVEEMIAKAKSGAM
ncbi:SufD family Fe-S cluster assembly protein [Bauldia sp.]|uniref:SufD family Fe-S cluster assembly protein n=1 Tax=Bauldia sp. TaxID=2575872 RepID=UPI003BAAEFFC